MGLFDGLNQAAQGYPIEYQKLSSPLEKRRTFREQVQDQIAYHQSKIDNLQAVLDSMTPDVERFVEATQKASL